VAQVIQKSIRGSDACFRYGGEEFLVCVTNSNLALARVVAERIRIAISANTRLPDKDKTISASCGIAHYNNESDWPELVARADKALYAAKEQGRNRVVTSVEHNDSNYA
jgi:diguanylate cyclase (GGDEF)-like protein